MSCSLPQVCGYLNRASRDVERFTHVVAGEGRQPFSVRPENTCYGDLWMLDMPMHKAIKALSAEGGGGLGYEFLNTRGGLVF